MSTKVQKIMTQPIGAVFHWLQNKRIVRFWLYDRNDLFIEGQIIGFDEFMNVVVENAKEVKVKTKSSRDIGRILLRGDNISALYAVE